MAHPCTTHPPAAAAATTASDAHSGFAAEHCDAKGLSPRVRVWQQVHRREHAEEGWVSGLKTWWGKRGGKVVAALLAVLPRTQPFLVLCRGEGHSVGRDVRHILHLDQRFVQRGKLDHPGYGRGRGHLRGVTMLRVIGIPSLLDPRSGERNRGRCI